MAGGAGFRSGGCDWPEPRRQFGFWRHHNVATEAAPLDTAALVIAALLLLSSVVLVVFAQPVISFTEAAAEQILDVRSYLQVMQLEVAP